MLDISYWFVVAKRRNPRNYKSKEIAVCGTNFVQSDADLNRHEASKVSRHISIDAL